MMKHWYDPKIHHRQSIRMKGHDYAGGGAYFVTICAHRRAGDVFADAAVKEMIGQVWRDMPHVGAGPVSAALKGMGGLVPAALGEGTHEGAQLGSSCSVALIGASPRKVRLCSGGGEAGRLVSGPTGSPGEGCAQGHP